MEHNNIFLLVVKQYIDKWPGQFTVLKLQYRNA